MKTKRFMTSVLGESLIWGVTSTAFMAFVVGVVYLVATSAGWGVTTMIAAAVSALVLSLTWGSWACLIWTRNRGLRLAMESSALLPGGLILALGVLGLYIGWSGWWLWLGLLGPALGTMAAAVLLARDFSIRKVPSPPWTYLLGWTVFPLLTTAASGAVAYLCLRYITRPIDADWRSLLNFASFMITMLSVALITTVIPAGVSRLCRQMAASLSPDN